MDWLLVGLEIAVAILCIVFEVLYFKEKARRRDEELMYLEHRERWLQICERQKKRIEELEDKIVLYKDQEEILLRLHNLDLERDRLFPF
jgi:uncharacterized protein YacL (UPF0231 family)